MLIAGGGGGAGGAGRGISITLMMTWGEEQVILYQKWEKSMVGGGQCSGGTPQTLWIGINLA
jgi:hypothetical protein